MRMFELLYVLSVVTDDGGNNHPDQTSIAPSVIDHAARSRDDEQQSRIWTLAVCICPTCHSHVQHYLPPIQSLQLVWFPNMLRDIVCDIHACVYGQPAVVHTSASSRMNTRILSAKSKLTRRTSLDLCAHEWLLSFTIIKSSQACRAS